MSDISRLLQKVSKNEPEWGPRIQVDVVVRLVDRGNKSYLLKASKQFVGWVP